MLRESQGKSFTAGKHFRFATSLLFGTLLPDLLSRQAPCLPDFGSLLSLSLLCYFPSVSIAIFSHDNLNAFQLQPDQIQIDWLKFLHLSSYRASAIAFQDAAHFLIHYSLECVMVAKEAVKMSCGSLIHLTELLLCQQIKMLC